MTESNSGNILYSCYSFLAYQINQKYYDCHHYTWCTPHFDPASKFSPPSSVPPTSSPREIYDRLHAEVMRGDRHSPTIDRNKLGILRGADVKFKNRKISKSELKDINAIVKLATFLDFRPLIFVVPLDPVFALLRQVAVRDRAHPMSQEYIIEDLPRTLFDVIEFR